jgi:hypothetical protein
LLPKIGGTPWIGAGVGVPNGWSSIYNIYNSRNGNWIFIDLNLCDWCGDVARGCSAPSQASSYPPAVAALRKKSKFDVESLCTLRPAPETCSSIGLGKPSLTAKWAGNHWLWVQIRHMVAHMTRISVEGVWTVNKPQLLKRSYPLYFCKLKHRAGRA